MMFTLETTMKLQFVENIHGNQTRIRKVDDILVLRRRGSAVNDQVKRYFEFVRTCSFKGFNGLMFRFS